MKIVYEKTKWHRFAWYFSYRPERIDFARTLKETFGWQNFTYEADGDKKRWVFSQIQILETLVGMYPQCDVDTQVRKIALQESKIMRDREESSALIGDIKEKQDTTFNVKGLKGEPYPYQKVGIEFIDASGGKTIVADAPGLGKTLQALGYAVHKKFHRILVVAPASVKFSWKNEVEKWTSMTATVLSGKPTSEVLYSLLGFLFFDDKVGGYRLEEDNDVHRSVNDPSVLCLHCLENRIGLNLTDNTATTSKTFKDVHKNLLRAIDTHSPSLNFADVRRTDRSFSVDDASDISKKGFVCGHDDGSGLSFPPFEPRLSKPRLKGVIRDPHNFGGLSVCNSSGKEVYCSSCGVIVPRNGNTSRHGGKVIVINYDLLKAWYIILQKLRFEYLAGDEAHLIKSPSAQRTKAFRQIAHTIPHVVLLTGTPILSRPVELFSLLNIVDPNTWSNYYDYVRRYCAAHQTRYGLDVSGISNAEELHERIKGYFIRRKKDEVLRQLPPKNHISLPIELEASVREEYDLAEESLATYLIQNRGMSRGRVAATMRAEKLARLNVLRMLCARGKVPVAKEIIDGAIASGEKILVFSSFVEPLNALAEAYGNRAVMITGSTSEEDRKNAVVDFQEKDSVKLFLGGFKSAGVGITLTAAQNVLFLDYSWNPADHQQAEDRCFSKGTPVLTPNGYVPIEKIKNGDMVITHTGRAREVTDTWSSSARNKTMTTVRGVGFDPIRVTSDHKILVAKRGWVEAQEIRPKDTLEGPKSTVQKEPLAYITLPPENRVPDTFVNGNGVTQRNGRIKHFEDILLTDDALFSLGYYIGDGCSRADYKKGGAFVSFSGNPTTKKESLERVEKWMLSIGMVPGKSERRTSIEHRYHSLELARFFKKEFGHGAKNKKIPEWMFDSLSIDQQKIVLDGLVASDGHVRKGTNKISYTTTSKMVAVGVWRMVSIVGRRATIGWWRSAKAYHVDWVTADPLIGKVTSVETSLPSRDSGSREYERVYDITVDEDETVVVNGIVAHNCHRPGATAECLNIYQLFALNTIDDKLEEILESKKKIIDRIIEGEILEDDDDKAVDAVIKNLMVRHGNKLFNQD